MRIVFILFVLAAVFSCTPIHYFNKPIKAYPDLSLQADTSSKGILLAGDHDLQIDSSHYASCLEGVKLGVELQSELKVIDEISFDKSPNSLVLMQLKAKYGADGLLYLSNLKMQKKDYEVPSKKLYLIHPPHTRVQLPDYYAPVPWTNMNVKISSRWEYFDFNTGLTYAFSVRNEKLFEFESHKENTDSLLETKHQLLDPFFYQNGKIAAGRVLGVEEEDGERVRR